MFFLNNQSILMLKFIEISAAVLVRKCYKILIENCRQQLNAYNYKGLYKFDKQIYNETKKLDK